MSKKQKVSIPVFVGGLYYSWRQLSEDEVANRLQNYIEKRLDPGDDVEIKVEASRAHAIIRFEGSRKSACTVALRALQERGGRVVDNLVGFAEIKPHNDCELSELKAGALHVDNATNEEQFTSPILGQSYRQEGAIIQQRSLRYPNEVWAEALGVTILRPHIAIQAYARPLLHKLQSQCLNHVQAEQSSCPETDWRAWAIDLPAIKGAPKVYLAATIRAFEKAYYKLKSEHRHCYEIIQAERSCFAYFDLEEACFDDRSHQVEQIAQSTILILREYTKIQSIQADIIILDSSRPGKFSQHLIVRTSHLDKEAPLENFQAAKIVATLVQTHLTRQGLHTAANLIDNTIYTKNRCFRLIGSSKISQSSKASAFQFVKRILYNEAGREICHHAPTFADTLVIPLRTHDKTTCLVLRESDPSFFGPANILHAINNKPSIQPSQFNDSVSESQQQIQLLEESPRVSTKENWVLRWRGATTRPLLDLIDITHPFLRCSAKGQGSPPKPFTRIAIKALEITRATVPESSLAEIRLWYYKSAERPPERYLHLVLRNTRYCHARGRQHKSQKTMITIDPSTGDLWQRCFDSADCCTRTKTKDGDIVALSAKFSLKFNVPTEFRPDIDELVEYEVTNELAYHQETAVNLSQEGNEDQQNISSSSNDNPSSDTAALSLFSSSPHMTTNDQLSSSPYSHHAEILPLPPQQLGEESQDSAPEGCAHLPPGVGEEIE